MSGLIYTFLNFFFLAQHDDAFVHHADSAEHYVFDDPNPALTKPRQFGDREAQDGLRESLL